MEKLPPIEKIYEAYSALADNRIDVEKSMAYVDSSDGTKRYKVEWVEDMYSSTDNATYWQGYTGYPVIGILILQKKLKLDESIIPYFSGINWNELNQKHKRDYRAALLEVFEQKKLSKEEIEKIENMTQQVFEQLQDIDIKIVRKIKR